jgi:Alkyl sulfatase dimerisation/Alkyl sulfatase C-terminal
MSTDLTISVEDERGGLAAMGGADQVLKLANEAYAAGDFRWVVELLNHVIFADDTNQAAKELQADAFEQLGFGAENGTWRSEYLAGAYELRHGSFGTATTTAAPDLMAALTPGQLFDAIAIRVDGPKAWDERLSIGIDLEDKGASTNYRLDLNNGVRAPRRTGRWSGPDDPREQCRASGPPRREDRRDEDGGRRDGAGPTGGRAGGARPGLRDRDPLMRDPLRKAHERDVRAEGSRSTTPWRRPRR